MPTKHLFASWFMALSLLLVAGQAVAQEAAGDLPLRICANLANESQRILDDTSTTTKYLSPYIAAEVYQQVVDKTVASAEVQAPAMAALPCGDTVATYLMAIKKRMEYNRVDFLMADHRRLIITLLILALIAAGGWFIYRKQQLARKESMGSSF